MNLAFEIAGYGAILPIAVSTAILVVCNRTLPESIARRYVGAVAAAGGFIAGYVLLPEWANVAPQRHWQWLPYLAAMAMIMGPLGLAQGVSAVERTLLYALLGIIAASLLVPSWESLKPPRSTYIPLLGGYLLLTMALLEPLPKRVSPRLFVTMLSLAGMVVAATIAACVSIRYGRVAGVAAAAVIGGGVAGFGQAGQLALQGLVPVYAVLIGGAAFVGFVEPEPPLAGILFLPLAPVALWAVAWGPFRKLNAWALSILQIVSVLIPLVFGVVLTLRGLAE